MKKETTLRLTTFDNQPRWNEIEFSNGVSTLTVSQCPDLEISFEIDNGDRTSWFFLNKENTEQMIEFLQNQLKITQD